MSSDWPIVRLGDYCLKIGSGATPRGGASVYLDEGEICLIRSQNVYNDGFNPNGLVYITKESAEKLKNVIVEINDVLLNITGDSVARVCIAKKEYLPARVNQHVAIIRPKPDEFDPRYLRYLLSSPAMQGLLLSIAAVGATRNALTKNMIETLEVPKPPISIQLEIADQLEVIESKIELNRQTNQTLENIAQAIFKSWFVDFEPTRAKVIAKKNGQDPELAAMAAIAGKEVDELSTLSDEQFEKLKSNAALFPDRFNDSELGEIPDGWDVRALDEIAHYQNGLALQKFRPENENHFLPVLKIAQLKKGFADGAEKASPDIKKECVVDNGDVVFSWSGSLMIDVWCGGKAALNQHLFKVTSEQYPKWFYYYWTKRHLESFQQIAADKAVTMGHIKRSHLSEAKCAVPNVDMNSFQQIGFLLDKIVALRLENTSLEQIRDTLLPKLLSGEVEMKMDL